MPGFGFGTRAIGRRRTGGVPPIPFAPTITVANINGTPEDGEVLTVQRSATGYPSITWAYQWQKNGANIAGQTAQTITLDEAGMGLANGDTISCELTATNSQGSDTAEPTIAFVGTPSTDLTISTAPAITGDPIVGQMLGATNGTYSATPDDYTYQWFKGGVAIDGETGPSYLVQDADIGSTIGYEEVATKAGYTDSPANAATATAAVTDVNLTNAITAFERTSASGVTPMNYDITFGANVYSDYNLWARVYSDAGLSTLVQDVTHVLSSADLEGLTDISAELAADGLTAIGATDYLRIGVTTLTPAGSPKSYVFPDPISPTDVTGYRYAKLTATSVPGGNFVLREIMLAESVGGANIASGKTYTYAPTYNAGGSFASDNLFNDNISSDQGAVDGGTPTVITIDFGALVNPVQLRLYSHNDFTSNAPAAFTLALSVDGVTYETPVVDASGLTWTANEIKTWDW